MTTTAAATSSSIDAILKVPVNEKGFVTETVRDEFFKRLRQKFDNRCCVDCETRNPTWLSLTYAVFLCFTCSGNHRRLGTHISFVRSCEYDNFSPAELVRLELGGNQAARRFFKSHGHEKPDYFSKVAKKYAANLDAEVSSALTSRGISPNLHKPNSSARRASHDGIRTSVEAIAPVSTVPIPSSSITTMSLSASQPVIHQESPGVSSSHSVQPSSNDIDTFPPAALPDTSSTVPYFKPVAATVPSTSLHVTTLSTLNAPQQMKAKKLDIDFDFEAFEKEEEAAVPGVTDLQEAQHTGIGTSATDAEKTFINKVEKQNSTTHKWGAEIGTGSFKAKQNLQAPPSKEAANGEKVFRNKANARSISSNAYFANETPGSSNSAADRMEFQQRISRFDNCNAISSDVFFGDGGRPSNKANTLEDEAVAQLQQLSDVARQGAAALAANASVAAKKARDYLNSALSSYL